MKSDVALNSSFKIDMASPLVPVDQPTMARGGWTRFTTYERVVLKELEMSRRAFQRVREFLSRAKLFDGEDSVSSLSECDFPASISKKDRGNEHPFQNGADDLEELPMRMFWAVFGHCSRVKASLFETMVSSASNTFTSVAKCKKTELVDVPPTT